MVIKREFKRHLIKLSAEVSDGDQVLRGTTVRVSEKGFFVRSQTSFCVGTHVNINLHTTNEDSCHLNGIVRFARSFNILIRQNGMGIELTEKDPKYLKFIRSFEQRMAKPDSGNSRYKYP